MVPVPESKDLARAIRRHALGMVGTYSQKIVKADVVNTSPLAVELTGSGVVVEEEHLLLGAWVRYFDRRWQINEGDTVLMVRLADGDWYVSDVVSQDDFELGDHPELMTSGGYNTGAGLVVAEIPYRSQDGTLLGTLLLYDGGTLRNFSGHTTSAGSGAGVVADP